MLRPMTHPVGEASSPRMIATSCGVRPRADRWMRMVKRRCAGPSKLMVSLLSMVPSEADSLTR